MRFKILLIIAIISILIAGGVWTTLNLRMLSYTIPGVPSYNYFNTGFNIGEDVQGRRLSSSSTKAVLDMVFDYWSGKQNYLQDYPPGIKENATYSLSDLALFARSQTYEAEVYRARSPRTLHRFINDRVRTPVIVFQPTSQDYRGRVKPFRLVIGLDDRSKMVTVHDFVFGNNYQISYDEFYSLWKVSGYGYLVVRPRNWKERVNQLRQTPPSIYPERTPPMDKKELLEGGMRMTELLYDEYQDADRQELLKIFQTMLREEDSFELFPAWWKAIMYSNAAVWAYSKSGQSDKAIELAEKAEYWNTKLNEPHQYWEYQWPYASQAASILIGIGDVYKEAGNYHSALDRYNQAWALRSQLSSNVQKLLDQRIQEVSQAL